MKAAWSKQGWKMAAGGLLLALILLAGGMLFSGKPGLHLGQDTEAAQCAHTANEFLARHLTLSAASLETLKPELLALMTPEYAQAYQLVWQDPKLITALRQRDVQISVSTELAKFLTRDAQGRYYVEVAGKVTARSKRTAVAAQERSFRGTVVLVKSDPGFKIANVVWRNTQ
jgi:hypothetical protein